jgi:small multidrug resistance family-3 protein
LSRNLIAFAVAAFFEIAGCFAFWLWLRRGASPLIAVLGIAKLGGVRGHADARGLGIRRAYAAYGGIYIAASLVWLWIAEGQRPNVMDVLGACIAIVGTLVIIGFAARQS